MKRIVVLLLLSIIAFPVFSQKDNFTYRFYGFVRGDLVYDTRSNVTSLAGNFYILPMDVKPDANGKDLNAVPSGNLYTLSTRMGLDLAGPMVGSARTSGKIETDFGGFASSTTMMRIRHAYMALDWDRSRLLVGQTWHPLFENVVPNVLSLSTGSPYQPFGRNPQIRYQYNIGKASLTAATIWQLQSMSTGPNGKSSEYIRTGLVPETYIGAEVSANKNLLLGVAANMISIKPRISSVVDGNTYKVNEQMNAFSYGAYARYTGQNITIAARTLLASSMEHGAMIGGYGVSAINPENGEQKYTPFRHSASWLNVTYGRKWRPSLLIGYSKSLGTSEQLVDLSKTYGSALNVDQLLSFNISLSYNLSHWRFGMEYLPATAWYGDVNLANGRVEKTYTVTNHRILALMVYFF